MASRNPETVVGTPFHARKPPSENKGDETRWSPSPPPKHKIGLKVSPKDKAPEFHCQRLPPGSAPPEHTFEPAVGPEQKYGANYNNPEEALGMPGMTAADADKSMGHPAYGETSWEIHHDGRHGHPPKRDREGLARYAGTHVPGKVGHELKAANPRIDPRQRALDKDVIPGRRGHVQDPPAEDRGEDILWNAEEAKVGPGFPPPY